jgi:Uma2 family endonuclease
MLMKRQTTFDDLDHVEGLAEIVNGEIVMLPPKDFRHTRASMYISDCLVEYEVRTQLGWTFITGAHYRALLPHRMSFCPDVSFYQPSKIGKSEDGSLALAVEIRSAGDYGLVAERTMAAKRADYFAAGTKVVWDVDIRKEGWIRSYRAEEPTSPLVFKQGDYAHAEPALMNWSMCVSGLMAEVQRVPLI